MSENHFHLDNILVELVDLCIQLLKSEYPVIFRGLRSNVAKVNCCSRKFLGDIFSCFIDLMCRFLWSCSQKTDSLSVWNNGKAKQLVVIRVAEVVVATFWKLTLGGSFSRNIVWSVAEIWILASNVLKVFIF